MPSRIEDDELCAVDIRLLSNADISWQTIRDGIDASSLPRRNVKRSDFNRAAVLSWRWDRDVFNGRSRNIALALHYAMQNHIEFLFLDLVTVDQTLKPEELLNKVAALSGLYRELPVIVAGDRPDVPKEEWDRTFRRPWLLHETRSYALNAAGITYLGYRDTTSSDAPEDFGEEVERVRRSGFAIYVFYVLWGYIGMQDPGDFRYILRPFFSLFTYLNERMYRDDYLFSVFLICAIHEPTQMVESESGEFDNGYRINFGDMRLETRSFVRFSIGDSEPSRFYETKRTISLDGYPVAEWRKKMTSSFDRNWIKVLPDADRLIFDVMNLPKHIREAYKATEKERLACLFLDRNAAMPDVRQFTAYQEPQVWRLFCALDRPNNSVYSHIVLGEFDKARLILNANWRHCFPVHNNASPRIAFLHHLIARLELKPERHFLGQLKTLLTGPELTAADGISVPWNIAYFIESLKPKLGEHNPEFLHALVAAINDRAKLPVLDQFPEWRNTPPQSLD